WNDPETEAEGWVVINSLRNGAAGGGTRMRKGLDVHEVIALAKTMEVKFTVSGPEIGGAKSGINFDPQDPRKRGVLERWYKAVYPLLKNYYGTGGDLNVDEIHEVIPITESYGLWHPQEGVVNGHFKPTAPDIIKKIGRLRQGVSKVLEDPEYTPHTISKKYTVADMITGFGVAESIRHFYALWGGDLKDKRVIIQGWGNVGATSALYLAKEGARVVGIIDRKGGLINPEGYDLEGVKKLFANREGNKLVSDQMLPFEEISKTIWDIPAEIFIPAAASRLVQEDQVQRLIKGGTEVISCGANVPFADDAIFFGPITELVDQQIALIPDFIANCGMARAFAYFMSGNVAVTDVAIFKDTSDVILKAMEAVHQINPQKKNISEAAFKVSLNELV
ncbi:MAG: Glu/Leu/Phe/Val dehydrogenase dimerization domain-containing protein, partial [Bacteroidota bacterium]